MDVVSGDFGKGAGTCENFCMKIQIKVIRNFKVNYFETILKHSIVCFILVCLNQHCLSIGYISDTLVNFFSPLSAFAAKQEQSNPRRLQGIKQPQSSLKIGAVERV